MRRLDFWQYLALRQQQKPFTTKKGLILCCFVSFSIFITARIQEHGQRMRYNLFYEVRVLLVFDMVPIGFWNLLFNLV